MTRRDRNERGSVMAEGAVAAIFVMFLFFMIFQAAFMARSYIAVRDAANMGGRAIAIGGDDRTTDYYMLQAVKGSMQTSSYGHINRVVIFKADGMGDKVPKKCLEDDPSEWEKKDCNVYKNDGALNASLQDFEDYNVQAAKRWPAHKRSTNAATGTDYVGVYVSAKVGTDNSPFPMDVSHTNVVHLLPAS